MRSVFYILRCCESACLGENKWLPNTLSLHMCLWLHHPVLQSVSMSVHSAPRCGAAVALTLPRVCLVCVQGTLQKFVDDVFVAILNTKRPPPIAVRFFFDFLDDMAEKHGIDDPETVHIWKTNRLYTKLSVNSMCLIFWTKVMQCFGNSCVSHTYEPEPVGVERQG